MPENVGNDETHSKKRRKLKQEFTEETSIFGSELIVSKEQKMPAVPKNEKKKEMKNSDTSEDITGKSNLQSTMVDVDTASNSTNISKRKKKNCKFKSKKKIKFKKGPEVKKSTQLDEATSRSVRAISYLDTWKNDRANWKFEKLTQFWLLKNMFDKTSVPKPTFQILLEYLVDLKGASKDFAVELCEGVIKKMEEKPPSDERDKVLEHAYRRARSILQYLQ